MGRKINIIPIEDNKFYAVEILFDDKERFYQDCDYILGGRINTEKRANEIAELMIAEVEKRNIIPNMVLEISRLTTENNQLKIDKESLINRTAAVEVALAQLMGV